MSCGLEFFSTEVSAAPPKVIAHVPLNELYSAVFINIKSITQECSHILQKILVIIPISIQKLKK
jgi:hypothetical protein